ncbi:MAG: hypothetical protein ACJ8CR_27245 [Roseiflexaceae bacterium]
MKRSGEATMLARNHDHRDRDRDHTPLRRQGPRSYSAVMPAHALDEHGSLIDQLIRFAFDTLGAQHLDLRIYEAKG